MDYTEILASALIGGAVASLLFLAIVGAVRIGRWGRWR